VSGRDEFEVEALRLEEPGGRVLLEKFDAKLSRGERVLIKGDPAVTGPLFKALGGLWPWGHGRIALPAGGDVLFVPQRPFLPQGALRDALCYPRPPGAYARDEQLRVLGRTGLGWLAERLDTEDNWEQALPLHAQQRLALARVLLHRPSWVFMEEATDGFDGGGERAMLEVLDRELPGATLVAIRYRDGRDPMFGREIVVH
jgi:putative ATP-binding cassette transporter